VWRTEHHTWRALPEGRTPVSGGLVLRPAPARSNPNGDHVSTTDDNLRDALQGMRQPQPGIVYIADVLAYVEPELERLRTDNAWLDRHYRQATEADEAIHEKLSDALGLDDGISWDALVDKIRQMREELGQLRLDDEIEQRATAGAYNEEDPY
jgi:hypothetical protein